MIVKNYTAAYWLDLFRSEASDLPTDRLRAWVQTESIGFPQALGACTEVGIFQVDLQDGPRYGATTATLHTNFCTAPCEAHRTRDLTDAEELLQVTSGAAMVREYYASAQSLIEAAAQSWSDDDTWCLTKLHHGLPALKYLVRPAALAGSASDWQSFRAWVLGLSAADVARTGAMSEATAHRYMPFTRFFDNAETVGYTDGAGLVGGGGLSSLGKAMLALVALGGLMYYGGRYGLV